MRISVIGGGRVGDEVETVATEVGRVVAQQGHTLVCGGLDGVMAAACRGAHEEDGDTVGIVPSDDRRAANDHVDTAIATGVGHARNALVVMNGDAVIAVAGDGGTLSEIGYASVYDRPVAAIGRDDRLDWVADVDAPAAAVAHVEDAVGDLP